MPGTPSDRGRIGCVELPALPLQLLLLDHPDWRGLPVAVVEADRPQAKLLWVNEQARRARVLPGMRFAAARSLASDLRAAVVSAERIEQAVASLFSALINFSPRVEPELGQPGSFWVDPAGMSLLWGDLGAWAMAIAQAMAESGYAAAVVVGFHRFRTHAIACARADDGRGQAWVIADARQEARMAASVPLDRLAITPRLRDALAGLGIQTLGQFMALPGPELRVRFGVEAERLHARGRAPDNSGVPLQARELVDPIHARVEFDPPEQDLTRLLFALEPALARLLGQLADRGMAMSALRLRLHLDHAGVHEQRLEPAAPTLDSRQVLELLRLRVDALALAAAIEEFELELEGRRTDAQQIALFRAQVRRDLEAGDRALARLRAALGPAAVSRAQLRPAHLPEARFSWVPATGLELPSPAAMQVEGELAPRIRRLLSRPEPLPDRRRHEPDGWILDPQLGPIERVHGPYRASGGWWVREVERNYYFAETRSGAVLWIFYDRPRRRWYLQGWLE